MDKTSTYLMASAIALASSGAMAEDSPHEFSANVALTTDYLFRGISQTEGNPALQGGFDYAYSGEVIPVGFYAGVWGSNIDFNDGADATLEVDYYGGLTGDLFSTGIGWDIGVIYYDYPSSEDAADLAYVEYGGGLSYGFENIQFSPEVSVYAWYSPEFTGNTGDAIYVNPSLDLSLPMGFGLGFGYGYQDVDDIGDYSHFYVGVSKDIGIFSLGVTYDSKHDENDFCGGSDLCDDTVTFTISSSF